MYRAAFDQAHGRVDHAAFEAVMARHRVFTRCLNLPRFEGCGRERARRLAVDFLTTVVTRRLHFSEPLLIAFGPRCRSPRPSASRISSSTSGASSGRRRRRGRAGALRVPRGSEKGPALRSLKLEVASSSEFLAGPDRYAGSRGRGTRKAGGGAPGARHCGRGRRHRRVSRGHRGAPRPVREVPAVPPVGRRAEDPGDAARPARSGASGRRRLY